MDTSSNLNKALIRFFLLAYAFSWLFWIPQALNANGVTIPKSISEFLASPLNPAAFGPLFAALVSAYLDEGGKGIIRLLKRGVEVRFKKTWLIPILLLPPLIFGGAILLSVVTSRTGLDLSVLSNPPFFIIGFFVILFTAGPLQEEFGWRGYALPRLQEQSSALVSSIILGIVWWLWHVPLVFIPGKFMVDNLPLFGLLIIEIVLVSILFTWIYNNTAGSILAALLFHASMNWSIWLFLPSMKVNASNLGYTILFLAIAVGVVIRIWGAHPLTRGNR